jgi:hypothetical protein
MEVLEHTVEEMLELIAANSRAYYASRALPPPPIPDQRVDTLQEACVKRLFDDNVEDFFDHCLDANFKRLMNYLWKRPKVLEQVLYEHEHQERGISHRTTSVRKEFSILLRRKIGMIETGDDDVNVVYNDATNRLTWNAHVFTMRYTATTFQIQKVGVAALVIPIPELNDTDVFEVYERAGKEMWAAADQAIEYIKKNIL